jgi:flagellar biosynthesis regulator FlbT
VALKTESLSLIKSKKRKKSEKRFDKTIATLKRTFKNGKTSQTLKRKRQKHVKKARNWKLLM